MPESRADCQSGSSLERPAARSSSRASDSTSSSVAYSGPSSSPRRRRSHVARRGAAAAGADGDHQIALAHDRREGERAVARGRRPSSPTPAGPRRPRTPRGRPRGRPVAVVASQAPSRSEGANAPLGEGRGGRRRPRPAPRRPHVRRDDVHVGPGREQGVDLAGGDAPGADHDAAAAGDHEVHRVAGDRGPAHRTGSSHGQHRRRLAVARLAARAPAPGHAAAGRRTGSAARWRGRPCAARRRRARSRPSARS